jgi:hypothetical protein
MFGEVQGIARRGSNDRNVDTSSIFDVGFLRNVLLLPPEVNIGYNNIISAGQLGHLRTVQDADGQFYVLNSAGDVISKGHVGDDNIFYLDDLNLLSAPNTPGSVRPTSRPQVNVVHTKKRRIRAVCRNKVNVVTRRGAGIDFKGVKRHPATTYKHPTKHPTKPPTVADTSVESGVKGTETEHRERSVSFSNTDTITSFDAAAPSTSVNDGSKVIVDTYVEEGTIEEAEETTNEQISGGDASEHKEIDRSDAIDASDNETVKDPRKNTPYKEYTAQPHRFRDDSNIMNFLHIRLGHQSDRVIKLMFKYNMISFLKHVTYDKIKDKHSTPCAACESAKSSRRPSVMSNMDISLLKPFEIVCSDIIGKIDILSNKREHYAVIYVCI